jgi:hypothetical protein
MDMDPQLVIVTVAAGAATVYAIRRVLLQFQRPDDEPGGCSSCPANRTGLKRMQRRNDAR